MSNFGRNSESDMPMPRGKKRAYLTCSRGCSWPDESLGDKFLHNGRQPGDRCPNVIHYDRMSGTTLCRRILKREYRND